MTTTTDTGLEGFLTGLQHFGLDPVLEAGVVTFAVELLDGSRTRTLVQTGVGVDELASWPVVPPHWVHLPADIAFAHSNTQASPKTGWVMHSRQIRDWGNARDPAQAWVAHVRAVLEGAT